MALALPLVLTRLISLEQQLPMGEKSRITLLFKHGYTTPNDGAQGLA